MKNRKEYHKQYYLKNKERIIKRCRDWRQRNPEKCKEMARNYGRNKRLETHGKVFTRLQKRKHPGYCELCKAKIKRLLVYHHWNENNLNIGLWLCFKCHQFAETVDSGIKVIQYKKLKRMAENEVNSR